MADSRIEKTGGLLDQWTLLSEIIADKRTRKPHIQIAQIVIDRQKREHGNSQASVRYIERGTGLSKWRISKATAELAEWGYFTRRPGAGTRPSEFTATSWPSVRVQRDSKHPTLVSESEGTQCPSLEGRCGPLVSESEGTNPAYVDGLQAGLREAECSVGAATPPALAGLEPATPETPPGGFVELWDAFSLKLTNTKAKARAAYDKLAPEASLHATIVGAAARLHAHYEEHAIERRYRIQLQNWITARGWEDDLPVVYSNAKSAAIAKLRGSAKPVQRYDEADRSVRPKAEPPELAEEDDMGRRRSSTVDAAEAAEHDRKLSGAAIEISVPSGVPLTVVSTAVEKRGGDTWMALQTDRGRVAVLVEGSNAPLQDAGQEHLQRLAYACGVDAINDPAELHGTSFMIALSTFAALPEREAA
ncbi:hypothetical protein [Bradyrhizobium sp. 187]|uniref:hypothetical protein n=1 Tax=Bradyrhizobium sp. 187 TaxID=2782655 RepID=UPI001FFEDE63|nr:hypothetical protein [Bradyrhizobium sp. 187]UPJ69870.1 hypothetical protein IVB19_19215 [Bradyrhizobium sp. 187]